MEASNLILSIDEGPKKGETFDRRPGSFIRIGRVVRGNTLAIKDARISQKHLIVEFHPEISRWAVTDLGTSNGTTVNGAVISPNAAFTLANGDIIEIGESTLMSVKIYAPSSVPEPRTRRGRRAAADVSSQIEKEAKEEKVVEPAKHGEKGASQGKACPESANVDYAVKRMPEEGKRRMPRKASAKFCSARVPQLLEEIDAKENEEKPTKNYQVGRAQRKKGIISVGASKSDKALDPVVEEHITSSTRKIELSARALKEKNEEREIKNEEVEGPTKNGRKGMSRLKSGVEPARVLRKDASLRPVAMEEKKGRDVKVLSVASSARVLILKEEEVETSEKIEGLVEDGRGGRARRKRGCGSSRVSSKDDVLEPAVVEGRKGRLTRLSTIAISSTALVSNVHEGEDAEIKEDKVEEPANKGGKQMAKGKRGGRSSRISRKCEVLESSAIGEKVEGSLRRALDVVVVSSARGPKDLQKKKMMASLDLNSVYLKGQEKKKPLVKNNASGNKKKLAGSREVRFRIEEAENDNGIMMSGEYKTEDVHLLPKEELAYSWSSFSEIRGIPNTTSKYREDRMINCHATPFEARVERALNRGIAETSSSLET
ncbi:uncharacterized protein LOC110106545 [Dendrobium catenatum]|uniref:FHA domain-containing protein n=1 Tax=Dendrobium catenatum TaxID=906689 RepID=A0A2I0X3S0_9ASPA|nr:uncharacterized protein LOC110106545 [Dendrobium catenatum]XP_028549595.1 uncharacterized protein LOC110106545 [Dendrobium catenatum]XP_028549596.1 uncharacterized protein LOC110106545 [Dendrobium catenatum]PKU82556.1 FHA domain-containing protein [Dendrobium catenatum]